MKATFRTTTVTTDTFTEGEDVADARAAWYFGNRPYRLTQAHAETETTATRTGKESITQHVVTVTIDWVFEASI